MCKLCNILLAISILFLIECTKKNPIGSDDELSWQEVESPTTKDLYSVFALSKDNAWAVGDSGVIILSEGETIELIPVYTITSGSVGTNTIITNVDSIDQVA